MRPLRECAALRHVRVVVLFAVAMMAGTSTLPGQAPEAWVFSGKAVDALSGGAVSEPIVLMEAHEVGVLGDSSGVFELAVELPRPVTVEVRRVGYETWRRTIEVDDSTDGVQVRLCARSLGWDGAPSLGIPEWPRHGIPRPVSSRAMECELDRQGWLEHLGDSLMVPDLRSVARAVMGHPDVVSVGNDVRGRVPLMVAIGDSSMAGEGDDGGALSYRFASGVDALGALFERSVPALAVLSLSRMTEDSVALLVTWDVPDRGYFDRPPAATYEVLHLDGAWVLRP